VPSGEGRHVEALLVLEEADGGLLRAGAHAREDDDVRLAPLEGVDRRDEDA